MWREAERHAKALEEQLARIRGHVEASKDILNSAICMATPPNLR
jgi:hypothetical protein